ncbi:MAG TPA: hypothetical protein VNI84_08660 [Pyrinomonadaceae bacterium]|nr:hypothetical protein [Pyrinomonadaceae bacterium]
MPKHTFSETTTIGGKVYFEGEAELSDAELQTVKGSQAVDQSASAPAPSAADLAKLNKAELTAQAAAEGAALSEEADTNKKIVDEILAARR